MQFLIKRNNSDVIEKALSCKEIAISFCGIITIDGKERGFVDTACHNYINFDNKNYGGYIVIRETNDSSSL